MNGSAAPQTSVGANRGEIGSDEQKGAAARFDEGTAGIEPKVERARTGQRKTPARKSVASDALAHTTVDDGAHVEHGPRVASGLARDVPASKSMPADAEASPATPSAKRTGASSAQALKRTSNQIAGAPGVSEPLVSEKAGAPETSPVSAGERSPVAKTVPGQTQVSKATNIIVTKDNIEIPAVPATVESAAPAPLAEADAAPSAVVPAEDAPVTRPTPPHHNGHERRPGMSDRPSSPPRVPSKAEIFVEGDHVVYPTHGVGKVERIAVEDIAGHRLELIHITFEENRMTLRVPVAKARSAGLRKLATRKMFDEALAVLKGRARIKRTMWSRRAQEYEAKINSGDPLAIAEVVRDLHRNAGQPDQSFSERQIYEAAMDRLAAELGALDNTDKATAATKLTTFLKTV